jgi:hypothetical protein
MELRNSHAQQRVCANSGVIWRFSGGKKALAEADIIQKSGFDPEIP